MSDFKEELFFIDSKENLSKTLENVLMVYLSSQEANDHKERLEALTLFDKLRELFV